MAVSIVGEGLFHTLINCICEKLKVIFFHTCFKTITTKRCENKNLKKDS